MTITSQWTIGKNPFSLKAKTSTLRALIINLMKSGLGLASPSATILIRNDYFRIFIAATLIWVGIREKNTETQSHGCCPKSLNTP